MAGRGVKLVAAVLAAAVVAAGAGLAHALFTDSAAVSANAFTADTLNAPTGLAASGGCSASLSWTATSDTYASGYRVLRGTASGGPYSQIEEITPRTDVSTTDSPAAGTYYYVLKSFYQNWESAQTSEVSATIPAPSTTYYLHNNPSPPTGNTTAQANLPLNATAPTAATLYNYDTDYDSAAGRLIQRGNGLGESDLRKYQNWRTGALGCALAISGNVTLTLWAAIEAFETGRAGQVDFWLRDWSGSSYTEIGSGSVSAADWQAGSGTYKQKTITLTGVNYTVAAGRYLEVRLGVNTSGSDRNMIIAYDTTTYTTVLTLP